MRVRVILCIYLYIQWRCRANPPPRKWPFPETGYPTCMCERALHETPCIHFRPARCRLKIGVSSREFGHDMRLAYQLLGYYAYRHERRFPDVRFTEARRVFANSSLLACRFGRGETLICKNTVDRSADTHIFDTSENERLAPTKQYLWRFRVSLPQSQFAVKLALSETHPSRNERMASTARSFSFLGL